MFCSGTSRPLGTWYDSVNRINKLLHATGPAVPQWEPHYLSLALTALYCLYQCRTSVTLFLFYFFYTSVCVQGYLIVQGCLCSKRTPTYCVRESKYNSICQSICYNIPTKICMSLMFGSINTLSLALFTISEARCQSKAGSLPLLMYLKWHIKRINIPLICQVHTPFFKHCNPIKQTCSFSTSPSFTVTIIGALFLDGVQWDCVRVLGITIGKKLLILSPIEPSK